ncbi:MAG: class II glutamine amidotransferase, partial [Patescibacteria group bacterium]
MCGIVGYIGKDDGIEICLKGLKRLEYRGYDSAGMAVVDNQEIKVIKAKGRVAVLEEKQKNNPLKGSLVIAHTRWATHGVPSEENAHPHLDCHKQFAVVHNGIIENYA